MSDPLAPFPANTVSPLLTSAAAGNAVLDAARAFRLARGAVPSGGLLDDLFEAATRCLVKWTGGSALTLAPFSVLAYGTPIIDPATDAAARLSAARRPAFEGAAPTDATAPFVVTVRPIPGQKIGLAVSSGLVPVQIDVTDESHKRAVAVAGITDYLASSAAGGVPIVWKESGTGTKWAVVLVGDGGGAGGAGGGVSATPCLSDAWLKWVPSATNWTFYHYGGEIGGRCECFPTDDPMDPAAGIIATYVAALSTAPEVTWLGVAPVTPGGQAMIRTCCGCGSAQLTISPDAAAGARARFRLGGVHVSCAAGSGGGAVFTETLTDYCVGVLPDGRRYILFAGSSADACDGTLAGCANEYRILAVCGGPPLPAVCECPPCDTVPPPVAWLATYTGFPSDEWNGDWVYVKDGPCSYTAACRTNTSTFSYDASTVKWRLSHAGAVYEASPAAGDCTSPSLSLALVSGTGPATVSLRAIPGVNSATCCAGCDIAPLKTGGMHATFGGAMALFGSVALAWDGLYFSGLVGGCGPNGTTVRASCVSGGWQLDLFGDMAGGASGPTTACSPFSASLTGSAGPEPAGTCAGGAFTAVLTV